MGDSHNRTISPDPQQECTNSLNRTVCTPPPDPQQECPSCSPSIQPGEKRQQSDDSDCETEEVVHKAQKINERSAWGWLKACGYDDVGKEVILQAATIYRCLLRTENGYRELAAKTELVKLAWEDANKESRVPPLALTPDIAKIVSYWFCFNHVYCLNHSYLSDQGLWITLSGGQVGPGHGHFCWPLTLAPGSAWPQASRVGPGPYPHWKYSTIITSSNR